MPKSSNRSLRFILALISIESSLTASTFMLLGSVLGRSAVTIASSTVIKTLHRGSRQQDLISQLGRSAVADSIISSAHVLKSSMYSFITSKIERLLRLLILVHSPKHTVEGRIPASSSCGSFLAEFVS